MRIIDIVRGRYVSVRVEGFFGCVCFFRRSEVRFLIRVIGDWRRGGEEMVDKEIVFG